MMSGRARRMVTHHLRNRAAGELNLIPMIDILSVLVSFLLVYSTEVEVVQNSKGIEIPQSIVTARPRQTVVVMLTKDALFVQGEKVADMAELRADKDTVFKPLQQVLARPRVAGTAPEAEPEVTVMADKSLPYEVLKKVMQTATIAGFVKISFAAVEKDKPVDLGAGPAR
ncbi:MAG TPA: biopolymer transporter ExbD [Steroidobacteraceae bacterium]|nr:biopolymer transporter ExbD [Steroidobacteraceae bacterium]